jgi:hypothetical protein
MNSLDKLTERMIKQAAKNHEEYVLHQGHTLKKGKWVTLPNKKHVFILDGVIQAGPPALIGKNPKNLTPEDLSDESESLIPQSKAVSDKYAEELFNTQHLTPAKREIALEQLHHRMDSENDGNLHFFPGSEGKNLDALAQDFADFGPRNPKDTPENQAIWYNDRLQLMRELGSALGPQGKYQVGPHIENIQEKIDRLRGKPSESMGAVTPNPSKKSKPASVVPPVNEAVETTSVMPSVAPKRKKIKSPLPEEATIQTPTAPGSPGRYSKTAPEINQSDNAYRPPTPPSTKPKPSPYGLKGKDIVDPTLVMKKPVYYQMHGRQAASRFKNMEMIQIEADLRNCFLETMAFIGENVSHPVTKEVLLHINKSKMQKKF